MRTAILVGILTLIIAEGAVYLLLTQQFGFFKVFALDLLSMVAGFLLLRHQGSRALGRIHKGLRSGRLPGAEILDGALLFLAAFMLLMPGFVTDSIGLLLLIPAARHLLIRQIGRGIRTRSHRRRAGPAPAPVVELDAKDYSITDVKPYPSRVD